ncbi:MAG: hypothetical protein OEZ25_08960 [Candidatus Bathyarchaeota archaeon]|nr:hypothetical protein [Candidatus Bathyarchaeota archaeon]
MIEQLNIKLINKIKKPTEGNRFLGVLANILIIVLLPVIIVIGLLYMLVLFVWSFIKFGKDFQKPNTEPASEEPWNLLTNLNDLTIHSKYKGEIRFGPVYLELKSEPTILGLEGRTFGDWFFPFGNGIFLQLWNSTKDPNTDLIYLNTQTLNFKTVAQGIPSVNWNIVETTNGNLELNCDTGKEILKYQIELNSR